MSVVNKRWDGQTITPKHDSIQYDDGQNGILHGCEITHLGANILRIAEGYMVICGRLIEVDQTDVNCEVSSSGTLEGQLIVRLNLGAAESVEVLSEAAASLTELTQDDDANYDNGIYEIQLAKYNVNETTITNLELTAPTVEKLGGKVNELTDQLNSFSFRKEDGKKQVSTDGGQTWENFSSGAELLWTNPAPTTAFAPQKVSIDLSEYEALLVEVNTGRDTADIIPRSIAYIDKNTAIPSNSLFGVGNTTSSINSSGVRLITKVEESGITFGTWRYGKETSNNGGVPTRIWGLTNALF